MGNDQLSPEYYNALTECADTVLAGERTIDDCLAAYPQFAVLLKSDLQIVVLTRQLKSPRLGPEQLDALENQLRTRIARRSGRKSRKVIGLPMPMLSRTAAAILLAFLILIGGGGGIVAASADSDPGDDLYVVKRTWEHVIIAFYTVTGIPEDIWIRLAETRLNEVRALSERDRLTVAALADLQEAIERVIDETPADSLGELEPFLQHVQETLADSTDVSGNIETITRDIMAIVEPVIEEIRADSDHTPGPANSDSGLSPPQQTGLPEETGAPRPVDMVTPSPEETVVPAPILTDTVTATDEPTATAPETATPSATHTPRFPPTPTRTPTVSPTGTLSPTPTLNPTASWTPLPTPTRGGYYVPPTNATDQPQPTLPGTTYVPPLTATWYPWAQATFDAAYLTQTAEAYDLMTITAEAATP